MGTFRNQANRFPAVRLPTYMLRRQVVIIFVVVFTFLIVGPTVFVKHRGPLNVERPDQVRPRPDVPPSLQEVRLHPEPLERGFLDKFHLLLFTPSTELSLCKTLLTSSVLGYPVPVVLQSNETYDLSQPYGGGRHAAKINSTLQWLDAQPSSSGEDIVMMIDAYGAFNYYDIPVGIDAYSQADLWFQLPPEILLMRYHAINARANEELEKRLGRAAKAEHLKQTVVFGSSKRCAPNLPQSIACYAMPESPLPDNLYGVNTDTVMGHSKYSSHRQRYLNSAFVMGPIADVRKIYKRAAQKLETMQASAEGSHYHGPDFTHIGSDQYIFQEILGEQEFQREVMRRRHLTFSDKAKGLGKNKQTFIEGTPVDDILNPSFTHETMEQKSENEDEFGMGVDYWSDIGQQTMDSEEDTRWITYNRPVAEQLTQRRSFDCTPHASGTIPEHMLNSSIPRSALSDASQFSPMRGWDEISLYTNICLDTIPVLLHHNGVQKHRDDAWPQLWLQVHGRRLIEEMLARGESGEVQTRGGIYTESGNYKPWADVCPAKLEQELYLETPDI